MVSEPRAWTVEQEREALERVLDMDLIGRSESLDVPSAMWGAATALIQLRKVMADGV